MVDFISNTLQLTCHVTRVKFPGFQTNMLKSYKIDQHIFYLNEIRLKIPQIKI